MPRLSEQAKQLIRDVLRLKPEMDVAKLHADAVAKGLTSSTLETFAYFVEQERQDLNAPAGMPAPAETNPVPPSEEEKNDRLPTVLELRGRWGSMSMQVQPEEVHVELVGRMSAWVADRIALLVMREFYPLPDNDVEISIGAIAVQTGEGT